MRFLWESNAPWAGTGYGSQTKLMLPALREFGHTPECFAFYGLEGGMVEYDGYKVWPGSAFDSLGNDVVKAHLQNCKPDAMVTLLDLFILRPDIWGDLGVPWFAWIPIDAEDIGFQTIGIAKLIDYPVAMSFFGAQELVKAGLEKDIHVIYHACDTDTFVPKDKRECRAELGIEYDAFVVGMVMANKGDRKQFPAQLMAVKRWADEHPDRKVRVYLHTDPTAAMGGWDMRKLTEKLGLKGMVYASNQYFTSINPPDTEMMATIYNSFDVLMNCSAGEGFGIPIIEAQACGVPVIAGDWTAMPELVHNGYCVKPQHRQLGFHYGYQFNPSPEDMVYRLECVYRMADSASAQAGRDWVVENCSVPIIAELWNAVLRLSEGGPDGSDELSAAEAVPARA